jgi:hypothetical protein
MVWCCPGNLRSQAKAIVDTQHLAWTATTLHDTNPSFWTRGLLGIQGLPEVPMPEELSYFVGNRDDLNSGMEVTFATDGSGVDGPDASNRRCGWGWVVINSSGDLLFGGFGTLGAISKLFFGLNSQLSTSSCRKFLLLAEWWSTTPWWFEEQEVESSSPTGGEIRTFGKNIGPPGPGANSQTKGSTGKLSRSRPMLPSKTFWEIQRLASISSPTGLQTRSPGLGQRTTRSLTTSRR